AMACAAANPIPEVAPVISTVFPDMDDVVSTVDSTFAAGNISHEYTSSRQIYPVRNRKPFDRPGVSEMHICIPAAAQPDIHQPIG
ncbi:MAG TPA: hypothetical protein VIH16_06140, partial [Bellilinea sp.]